MCDAIYIPFYQVLSLQIYLLYAAYEYIVLMFTKEAAHRPPWP